MLRKVEPHEAIAVQAVEGQHAVRRRVDVQPPVARALHTERARHQRLQHAAVRDERDVRAAVLRDDFIELGERAVADLVERLAAFDDEFLGLVEPRLPFFGLFYGELGLRAVLPRAEMYVAEALARLVGKAERLAEYRGGRRRARQRAGKCSRFSYLS